MATTNELMDFVKSLNNRGLLSKTIEEFDYERVIWDYEKSKIKNLSVNPVLSDVLHPDSDIDAELYHEEIAEQEQKKCRYCGDNTNILEDGCCYTCYREHCR